MKNIFSGHRAALTALHGTARLAVDATQGVAGVVETIHRTVQLRPGPFGRHATDRPRGITGLVYRSIDLGIALSSHSIDTALALLTPEVDADERSNGISATRSVINGVYGDYLAHTANPLAIDMSLHYRHNENWGQFTFSEDWGQLPFLSPIKVARDADKKGNCPQSGKAGQRLVVLVHGLCMNELQWTREDYDHGTMLADELEFVPLYLRYNSGLPIARNGASLAGMLETLIANWPRPVEELVILGHSMGGLVARAACHHALENAQRWPQRRLKLVFMGTPHHGAPLEHGGHGLDLLMGLSPYSAPLTRLSTMRSAGIQDLRHGNITANAKEHVPLPPDALCYAYAAVRSAKPKTWSKGLIGDGLVPRDSALGRHRDPARTLAIPKQHQAIGYEMGHLALRHRREISEKLRTWLA